MYGCGDDALMNMTTLCCHAKLRIRLASLMREIISLNEDGREVLHKGLHYDF